MTPQSTPHRLTAEAIRGSLDTRRIGRQIEVFDEIGSTNDYLLGQIGGDIEAIDGLVVFAEHQTQGRGRLGRTWQSPRGASLLFSFLLWEPHRRLSPGRVMMAAAVAAVRGIAAATEIEPLLRWPNDLYVRDRKLGGILVEQRAAAQGGVGIAVGIGVNCLQRPTHFGEEVGRLATSLDIEAAHAVDRIAVARSLLRELDNLFAARQETDDEAIAASWLAHSADLGAHVSLTTDAQTFRGRIIDIHPTNGLLLQLDDGGRRHFDPAITSRS